MADAHVTLRERVESSVRRGRPRLVLRWVDDEEAGDASVRPVNDLHYLLAALEAATYERDAVTLKVDQADSLDGDERTDGPLDAAVERFEPFFG